MIVHQLIVTSAASYYNKVIKIWLLHRSYNVLKLKKKFLDKDLLNVFPIIPILVKCTERRAYFKWLTNMKQKVFKFKKMATKQKLIMEINPKILSLQTKKYLSHQLNLFQTELSMKRIFAEVLNQKKLYKCNQNKMLTKNL